MTLDSSSPSQPDQKRLRTVQPAPGCYTWKQGRLLRVQQARSQPTRRPLDSEARDEFSIFGGRVYRLFTTTGVVGACHLELGDNERILHVETLSGLYQRHLAPQEELAAAMAEEERKCYFHRLAWQVTPMIRRGQPDARKFPRWQYAHLIRAGCSSLTIDERGQIYVHRAQEGAERVVGRGLSGGKLRSCFLQANPSKEYVVRKISDCFEGVHVLMAFELLRGHPLMEQGRCYLRDTRGGDRVYSSLVPRYYGSVCDLLKKQSELLHEAVLSGVLMRLSCQLCEALGYLHEAGWLHGALRPEHMLVDYDPERPLDCVLKLSSFKKLTAIVDEAERERERQQAVAIVSFLMNYATVISESDLEKLASLSFTQLQSWLSDRCTERELAVKPVRA